MIRKAALILASLAMAIVLAPSEPAQAQFQETSLCVEASDAAMRWGVRHSIREWNSVQVGPRLVLRDRCPRGSRLKPFVMVKVSRTARSATGTHYNLGPGAHEIILNARGVKRYHPYHRSCVKRFTTTHELGHALGLEHYPGKAMAMGYTGWWDICGDITRADRRYKVRYFRSH